MLGIQKFQKLGRAGVVTHPRQTLGLSRMLCPPLQGIELLLARAIAGQRILQLCRGQEDAPPLPGKGFLLFPDVTPLDLTGPPQVLSRVPNAKVQLADSYCPWICRCSKSYEPSAFACSSSASTCDRLLALASPDCPPAISWLPTALPAVFAVASACVLCD